MMPDPGPLPSLSRAPRYLDFWVGMFLGIPIAYPIPQIQPFAISAFALVAWRLRVSQRTVILLGMLMSVSLASSLLSTYFAQISAVRVVTSTVFFAFFLLGYGIDHYGAFLRGFGASTALLGTTIIIAFFALGQYHNPELLFLSAVRRQWGTDIFPAWPNFLAFLLGLGMLVHLVYLRSALGAALTGVAALVTTSRTALLVWAIAGVWLGVRWWHLRWSRIVAVTIVAVSGTGLIVVSWDGIRRVAQSEVVRHRLLRTSDREAILDFSVGLVHEHPIMGVGHVLLNQDFGAPRSSFHSSYFDILIRHGTIGLLVWLALLIPIGRGRRYGPLWPFLLLFLIGSAFNTILRHPHLLMCYSALIVLGTRPTATAEWQSST